MTKSLVRIVYFGSIIVMVLIGLRARVHAACVSGEQACSSSYAVGQTFFGNGGSLDGTCSSSYCAKQSLGEIGQGLTSSPNYQAQAGFNVDRGPYLEITVNSSNINLGVLNSSSTATGTVTFSVKSYLSSGYNVISASSPPSNDGYVMHALASPTSSTTGAEQFGINLTNNTTACGAPVNFGAAPVQVPSASYSYGTVAAGYNSCGLFQYIPGSTIASSSRSSGETDYTISFIENISNITPAGNFIMNDNLVAVATF